MVETRALSPHLGVEVTGVGNLLDDAVVAQCLEATCKYHAWRYSLAGELSYVQQEEEFFGLDKADCGLKPVRRTRSPPITLRSTAMALLPAERFGMNDLPDPERNLLQ